MRNTLKQTASGSEYRINYRSVIKKDFKLNKSLYLLMLPVLAYYIIWHYVPMYGALIAFKNFTPRLGTWGSPWVGFKHFIDFFSSPSFGDVLFNTLRISLTTLIFSFPMPIILALLLNELKSARFSKLVQNATYLPHFISLVVICGMVKRFFATEGILTSFVVFFGGFVRGPVFLCKIRPCHFVLSEQGKEDYERILQRGFYEVSDQHYLCDRRNGD